MNPYSGFPDTSWWNRSVARIRFDKVDPVIAPKFKISDEDSVVTAGSCFAQHISRCLSNKGFNYLVTEQPLVPVSPEVAARFNYGTFSARYGNIYTARQLVQLIDRAYGRFCPTDDVWRHGDSCFDPYRPQIQPGGFASETEYYAERERHHRAVREALENCDVFVFTLGLTEAWLNQVDGAVYPIVPGSAAGEFCQDQHVFHNFSVAEVADDLNAAIRLIRDVNPDVRVLLTVSPVPLIATAASQHVLISTIYSKSVLRVAASMVCEADPRTDYFPSYEIITGPHARGRYFADDLREVTEEGVEHVMRLVFRHYTGTNLTSVEKDKDHAFQGSHSAEMERLSEIVCDEEVLGRSSPEHSG